MIRLTLSDEEELRERRACVAAQLFMDKIIHRDKMKIAAMRGEDEEEEDYEYQDNLT